MRPDDSCLGVRNIPFPYSSPCQFHYIKGTNYKCKLFDHLEKLRKKNEPPKGLLKKLAEETGKREFDFKDTVRDFFVWCLNIQKDVLGSVYGDNCIRCGEANLSSTR